MKTKGFVDICGKNWIFFSKFALESALMQNLWI